MTGDDFDTTSNDIFLIVVIVPQVGIYLIRRYRTQELQKPLLDAESLLGKHGYQTCLCFPAAGIADEVVAEACRRDSRHVGRLVLSLDGQLVDKVSPDTLRNDPTGDSVSRARLTLVLSNPDGVVN